MMMSAPASTAAWTSSSEAASISIWMFGLRARVSVMHVRMRSARLPRSAARWLFLTKN